MVDSEPNDNPRHLQDQQRDEGEIQINHPNLTEPIVIEHNEEHIEEIDFDKDTDTEYRPGVGVGRTEQGLDNPSDQFLEPVAGVSDDDTDDDDDDDYLDEEDEVSDDDDLDEDNESIDDGMEEEEEEDRMVVLPRVPMDFNEGGQVAGKENCRGEVGTIDGLMCPICMGAWTSGGDHQVWCLPCGHIYGLSCIRRWLEYRKGSAKCPQCNRKCKPKDVRVLFASRVVVADEESKEKIQFLEAKCALLEEEEEDLRDNLICLCTFSFICYYECEYYCEYW